MRFRRYLLLWLIVLTNTCFAQSKFVIEGSNFYNPVSERLFLKNVFVFPSTGGFGPGQYLYNTVFQYTGGSSFELISVDELPPEQECTPAEVLAAVPDLHLNLSVEDLDALIGCNAFVRNGQVDLETGALVVASWTGIDGIPNSRGVAFFNPFLSVADPSYQIVGSSPPAIFTYPKLPFAGTAETYSLELGPHSLAFAGWPFIRFDIKENVVESYTYSGPQRLETRDTPCFLDALLDGFEVLAVGSNIESVELILGCEGILQSVTVDDTGERKEYLWQPFLVPFFSQFVTQRVLHGSHIVSVSFLNDVVDSIRMSITTEYIGTQQCTAEDILDALGRIRVGDVVSKISSLVDCNNRRESVQSDGSKKKVKAEWRTRIFSASLYTSENRSLQVMIDNGIVTDVKVKRFR